jgi:hypothetical protein
MQECQWASDSSVTRRDHASTASDWIEGTKRASYPPQEGILSLTSSDAAMGGADRGPVFAGHVHRPGVNLNSGVLPSDGNTAQNETQEAESAMGFDWNGDLSLVDGLWAW